MGAYYDKETYSNKQRRKKKIRIKIMIYHMNNGMSFKMLNPKSLGIQALAKTNTGIILKNKFYLIKISITKND